MEKKKEKPEDIAKKKKTKTINEMNDKFINKAIVESELNKYRNENYKF